MREQPRPSSADGAVRERVFLAAAMSDRLAASASGTG